MPRVASDGLARVVPAALAATGAGLALEAGGYFPRAWVWSGVVLLWVAALAAAFRTPFSIDRRAAVFLGAVSLLTGWTLLSATWSVVPQQTLLEARRDVVYLGVASAAVFACSRLTARQIPGARFEVIPGVGHLANLEDPSAFNRVQADFLASVSRVS